MAERNYPNDYFAWFNDDQRLAILSLDTTSTDSSERTTEKYDTFQGDGNLSGNITATSTSAGSSVTITSASHGLEVTNGVGDRVAISGTTTYDGNYEITSSDTNTFVISATNSTSDEGASSGVTWTSLFIDDGLRMTYKSKYETVSAITEDLDTDIGLDTSLQPQLVCYMKSRLYEDQGNFEQANYFRQMYETQMMKQRSRKSGVRGLAVPNL
jgi:hypothetical protein